MTVLDKIFMMDCQTDGHLLQAAAETHQNAFSSVEAKRVTSAAPPLHPHSLSRVGPKSDSQPCEWAWYVGPSFNVSNQALTEVRVVTGASSVTGVKSSGLAKRLALHYLYLQLLQWCSILCCQLARA